MRLSSKGLGRMVLPLRLEEAERRLDRDRVVFEGRICDRKVDWTYRVAFGEEDLVGFLDLMRSRTVAQHLADVGGTRLALRALAKLPRFAGALALSLSQRSRNGAR